MMPTLVFWHWLILAVVLIAAEAMLPGTFLIWLGIAAGLVGLLLLLAPDLAWQVQLLVFAAVAVAAIIGWRLYQRRHPIESDQPLLNRRGEQHVGRVFPLAEPIVNGHGKVHIGDSVWIVEGPDLPREARVRVTACVGTILSVEAAN